MIDYIEVLDSSRELVGIIDTAQSIIWHDVFFGCGDFEIYAKAEPYIIELLQNPYIKRPDLDVIGVIERIEIGYNIQDGLMITASGRFAKSILDRRLIYQLSGHTNTPTYLSGKVEQAVRTVVSNNAISTGNSARNIGIIQLGIYKNYPEIILSSSGTAAKKQVSYQNLLEYTDSVLQEYGMSARLILDNDTKMLKYEVTKGTDRSVDNSAEPVIFSQDYDNLTESDYVKDSSQMRNVALIGGAGEGEERYYSIIEDNSAGLARREIFIDASSSENDTGEDYDSILKAQGRQELSLLKEIESFSGTINLEYSPWKLNKDFFLGDIVTVQYNQIMKYINVRITEVTEIQDENGYNVEVVYE